MPKVKFTVTIEPEQLEQLRRLQEETGLDASTLTRYALGQFLRQPAILLPVTATLSSDIRNRQKAAQ